MLVTSGRWTKEQLKLAFHLYCQLPFGRLHSRNPAIIELAKLIGRTPGALAMKLVNFASLDPAILASGRKGLGNASDGDRQVWDEFHDDWERLAVETQRLLGELRGVVEPEAESDRAIDLDDYTGETRAALVETRVKQDFFRRAVLSSYGGRCCMSGVAEPRLLMASHIVPWSVDRANRLNPRNGLCLSALHDRAYDRGLITVMPDLVVRVSDALRASADNEMVAAALLTLAGRAIDAPERFMPDREFLGWHAHNRFLG